MFDTILDTIGPKPRLLDLFCGAGGAAMGYHRAGFDVVGVDIKPQPRYPFEFIQADALDYCRDHGHEFDAIHASPPCQGYSRMRHLPWLKGREYPMLIDATREHLQATGVPWVIENVEDAPLLNGIFLCGTMFALKVYRHRKFESSVLLLAPMHRKHEVVIGSGRMLNDRAKPNADGWVSLPSKAPKEIDRRSFAGHFAGVDRAREAMDIDWMTRDELSQAIPPAYCEFIGAQLMRAVLYDDDARGDSSACVSAFTSRAVCVGLATAAVTSRATSSCHAARTLFPPDYVYLAE